MSDGQLRNTDRTTSQAHRPNTTSRRRRDSLEDLDQLLEAHLVGIATQADRSAIRFVSGNSSDVVGSPNFGFPTFWVNRAGEPLDRLGPKPDWLARTCWRCRTSSGLGALYREEGALKRGQFRAPSRAGE